MSRQVALDTWAQAQLDAMDPALFESSSRHVLDRASERSFRDEMIRTMVHDCGLHQDLAKALVRHCMKRVKARMLKSSSKVLH